jgi:hypothetical protein
MSGLRIALGTILAILLCTALLFYSGFIGNFYSSTVDRQRLDIERTNFEHSKSYIKGISDDLAIYKFEYEKTQDETEKRAIQQMVCNRFCDVETDLLSSKSLQNFLYRMRGY